MNLHIIAILALAILSLLASGPMAASKLIIGQSTINPRSTPLWIAQEKGYFQKYGIDATLVFVRNTPMMIASMKSGGIPIAYGGGSGILGAQNPRVADINVEDLVDTRFLRKLDESGFIDRIYATSASR